VVGLLKRVIRRLLERADRVLLPLACAARWPASLYYALLNPRFGREQRAVLAGRLAYERGFGAPAASSPLLRRNVHRLEKGLIMRPRLAVFAADYIGETVQAFVTAEQTGALDADELKWARDVLDEYFAVVADSPPIARARASFTQREVPAAPAAAGPADARSVPRPREQGAASNVTFDQFLALCRQRRSVRWFRPAPVARELVLKAVQAAAQAPSACNRQPFLFRYFERAADARRIAAVAMGTTGYADNIPALIVVIGDLSCFPHERDRHVPYIDAALATMQLMLALETLGLASCPINWPDVEALERRMQRELGLPPHLRPLMLLALGYPDPKGGVPHSAKKPPEALLRLDDDYPR
jgi:nitroreductase